SAVRRAGKPCGDREPAPGNWTYRSYLQAAPVPPLLNLHLVAVLQRRRSFDDHALAGADAREHFDLIARGQPDVDRAPLDAVLVEDEHDRLAVGAPHGGLRHD